MSTALTCWPNRESSLFFISIYCPFLCAYLCDSNKGVLAVRDVNSIPVKCFGEGGGEHQNLDLPAAGQLECMAPLLTSPAQPRNV